MRERAIFILTYNRGKRQPTYEYLKTTDVFSSGLYDFYFVCSRDDKKAEDLPSDGVSTLFYEKSDWIDRCDLIVQRNNPRAMKSPMLARNFIINWARDKYRYYCMFDDDYKWWENVLYNIRATIPYHRLLPYFEEMHKLSDHYPVAFMQNGERRHSYQDIVQLAKNKTMNTFFIASGKSDSEFISITEDDTCRFLSDNIRGKLHFQIPILSIGQEAAHRKKKGLGMQQAYGQDFYRARFLSVVIAPSINKIKFNALVGRLHHSIDNNFPKMLS